MIDLFIALLLALALLIPPMGAAAAEETVTSIYYESGSSTMSLYVGEDDQLRVWANLSGGSTSSKDVTLDAAWTSSNSQRLPSGVSKAQNVALIE